MILSLYIAGRRRLCEPVPTALMFRTLQAISARLPELELEGRVILTIQEPKDAKDRNPS